VATKKLYFKIGEACKQLDIQPYVLRYWETEFPALNPDKSKSGQRVYSEKDLQIIARIKELLYEEGFTIAGAKKKLEAELESGLRPLHKREATGQEETADGEGGDTAAVGEEAGALGERVDRLRQGVESALAEAREILSRLDSKQKSR
jgi:DNA-binding transcriptional MerR regulator